MAEESAISWTHATFNPWWGCFKVSPACVNCYAERDSKRFGLQLWGPTADRKISSDKYWNDPLRWDRKAAAAGERRRVFCASMADVFEDRRDLDAPRERLWDVIEKTKNLDWLLLTKRPECVARLAARWEASGWPENVWLGSTVESNETAALRIAPLTATGARLIFLSCEPMVEQVDLTPHLKAASRLVDWVICGGESGPKARPMHPLWARSLRDVSRALNIPFHFKQWGEWAPFEEGMTEKPVLVLPNGHIAEMTAGGELPPGACQMARVGKKAAGRFLDGVLHDEYPRGVKV